MSTLPRDLRIIAIGASAGGVTALHEILPAIKSRKVSVVVVLHFPPEGPNLIPSLYADECKLAIKEAESGEVLEPGVIYIAPPDYHLSTEPNGTLSLSNEEEMNYSRPSIDILFDSVAFAYKSKAMAILLTGANHDGAQGLKRLHDLGGTTAAQDPNDAEFPVMPLSALELFQPTYVLPLKGLTNLLRSLK